MKNVSGIKWYMAFYKKKSWLLLLIPISLSIVWMVQKNKSMAENIFALGIYKWFSQGMNFITGLIPISLMEVELLILPVLLIILFIRFIKKIIEEKQKGRLAYIITNGIVNVICTLSVVFFLFLFMGGINYYRFTFTEYSGLKLQESSVNDLYNLSMNLASRAETLRKQIETRNKEDSSVTGSGSIKADSTRWNAMTNAAQEAFDKLAEEYPVLGGKYGAPKPVYFSRFMSRMEITGIFWPFTMEANVNIDAPDYTIPATMLHELAHLRGFMREDEANFIAYLASTKSDDIDFQYSGVMLALSYTTGQLYKQDPDLYKKVSGTYNSGMLADLRENYYYWEKFDHTVISAAANTMNDTYLKANSQNDGVKSYGRMVDLLLAEYNKRN